MTIQAADAGALNELEAAMPVAAVATRWQAIAGIRTLSGALLSRIATTSGPDAAARTMAQASS
ncbi:hypothetical protein XapA_20260 [Xanthomonas citri pv. punicae]|nr:hypothetical protein XapA_20260 [Xanthomonas citri pv. punicae]QCZ88118.1 hypothetical protein DOO79_01475 [Xanthomonas citri pv. punicae]